MTKEEILQTFSDINHAYNNSSKYDTLKHMLDELTVSCEKPFKVGDIVKLKDSYPARDDCDYGIVTWASKRSIYVMRKDGSCCEEPLEEFELIHHSDEGAIMINRLYHIMEEEEKV